MKFTISNFHVGEISNSHIHNDCEGNVIGKTENHFGGMDMSFEVELTVEEFIDCHKTFIEAMKETGPLVERIAQAVVKVKNNI